jgi:hypothetical protein
MTSIIVDDEQAQAIAQNHGMVEVRNRNGAVLGYFMYGFTAEDVAVAKKRMRSNERRLTTQELLERLRTVGQK